MWILFVWIVSAICYLPLYFDTSGYAMPNILLQMKYLFVIVPIISALICVRRKVSIKKWLRGLFVHRIGIEPFVLWIDCILRHTLYMHVGQCGMERNFSAYNGIIPLMHGDFGRNCVAWILLRSHPAKEKGANCGMDCQRRMGSLAHSDVDDSKLLGVE